MQVIKCHKLNSVDCFRYTFDILSDVHTSYKSSLKTVIIFKTSFQSSKYYSLIKDYVFFLLSSYVLPLSKA